MLDLRRLLSNSEQDTPSGLKEQPSERSDQDRELAERLVAEGNEKGLGIWWAPTGS